jgi:hypothetical protein
MKTHPSEVLSDYQISNLAQKMDDALRGMSWVLLYRLSQDGASMITLMDRVQG